MGTRFGRSARISIALAVAGCVAVPVLAWANHVEVIDANDAAGPLDVRIVRVGRGRPPRWKIVTFNRWSATRIWDHGYLTIYFDTFGSLAPGEARFDYYGLLFTDGRRMKGHLFRDLRSHSDVRVGRFKVWRPNRRSVKARVPLRRHMYIGKRRKVYQWYVKTLFAGDRCPRVCFDRAPNTGAVVEPFSQEPSPTSTTAQ